MERDVGKLNEFIARDEASLIEVGAHADHDTVQSAKKRLVCGLHACGMVSVVRKCTCIWVGIINLIVTNHKA